MFLMLRPKISANGRFIRFFRTKRKHQRDAEAFQDSDILPLRSEESKMRFVKKASTAGEVKGGENSYEVAELRKEKAAKQENLDTKVLGKHIAQAIRTNRKISVTRSQNVVKQFNFSNLNEVELSKLLRKHVIYANESLAIFNKPYGITAHDGDEDGTSLTSCLPILSKMVYGLNTSVPLILCNRLGKGTTGITVCATSKDMAYKVMTLFRQQKVVKKYWAIIVGEPTPQQGVVDIPLNMRHIEGDKRFRSHCRMALAPEQKLDYETGQMVKVRQRKTDVAITHYRTLDSNEGLSLIELQPFTTARHQIRVHLAEGLSCCILGDHKYSQTERLLPQRLPLSILSQFHLKATRSRDMPMHLHLRELILPGVLDSDSNPNLLVSAKASEHFHRTMKLFKLKPGAVTDFKYPARLDSKLATHGRDNPLMEELYIDPFVENESVTNEIQRDDCYTVYKPNIRVKFKYD